MTDSYPDFTYAAGDCICEVCGKPYWRHLGDQRYLTEDGTGRKYPWLHRLCDGRLVDW